MTPVESRVIRRSLAPPYAEVAVMLLGLPLLFVSFALPVAVPASPPAGKPASLEEQIYADLRRDHMFRRPKWPSLELYVKGVEGRQLLSPIVRLRNAQGEVTFVGSAREGKLEVDKDRLLIHLRKGRISNADGTSADFEDRVLEWPIPPKK